MFLRSLIFLLASFLAVMHVTLSAHVPGKTADGFRIPSLTPPPTFPERHGSHPDYRTEWWYITGHLRDQSGGWWGYQATFFRSAGPIGEMRAPALEAYGDGQIYLAHMSIAKIATGTFIHQERLQREGWDAGAAVGKLDVWNGNWSLRAEGWSESGDPTAMLLEGTIGSDGGFSLRLEPENFGRVLFGENGLSRKTDLPASLSYYISFPRLLTSGTLRWKGRDFTVEGLSWKDHEVSSEILGDDFAGWDWLSLQLDNGEAIMAFQIRTTDGRAPESSRKAVWVAADGTPREWPREHILWEPRGSWISPATGADYPISPRLILTDPHTGKSHTFSYDPLIPHAEIEGNLGGVPYWEGPGVVRDPDGRAIGRAYLEMTGYSEPLGGSL